MNTTTEKMIKQISINTIQVILAVIYPFICFGQTQTENYIKTTSYQTETASGDVSINDKIEQVNYYDGLGRIKQSILVGGAGDFQNGFSEAVGSTDKRFSQVPEFVNDWTVGTGSTSFYNRNGSESENVRSYGPTPRGISEILWECVNDAASGADGGFNTDYFNVDMNSPYVFTIWVKKGVNSADGATYFGTSNVSSLSGTANSNPYFIHGKDLPKKDQWYLMVGVVHPYDYRGGDLDISGIYDKEGNKVMDGTEWKWNKGTTSSRMRAYLYYAKDETTRQYFWNPTVQKNSNGTPTGFQFDWREGVGSTPFFNRNGSDSENKRIYGEAPNGATDILWKCDNDSSSNADGGWNTDYFEIDPLKKYRYTTWVKRTGSQDGSTYHGTGKVVALNGTSSGNPYFWYGDLPTLDEWYLLVGVIHPSNYKGVQSGESGVYDINGNRVRLGTDFKWPSASRSSTSISTTTRLRSYFYYSTNAATKQYFWNPKFEEITLENSNLTAGMKTALASGGDIVTHYEYDALGRQVKNYLPYATEISSGGEIVENSLSALTIFYDTNKFDNTTNPYSETVFESLPLSRVLEKGAPGASWEVDRESDSDHTVKFSYETNTPSDEVRYFEVNFFSDNTEQPYLEENFDYGTFQLFKSIIKDENWTPAHGNDHTTQQFTDKLGRVLLKRGYSNGQRHDTNYVYDDFGNLTFVLSPEASASTSITESILDKLCYQYKYDYRNRLIEKKVPGKGWEYIVYNKLDQPVMTQDAMLRAQGVWLFTKYDVFGRVAYTGKTNSSASRLTMQNLANGTGYEQYEIRSNDGEQEGGTELNYSNEAIPQGITEIFTINYYDDYDFDWDYENGLSTHPTSITSHGISATQNVKGLPTGSKVRVLDTDDWIISVTSYDYKGRSIYSGSYNKYLGTVDRLFTQLDFVGRPLITESHHTRTGVTTVIEDVFEYDSQGRLLTQDQRINDAESTERIVENTYDELGSLSRKRVGGETESNNGGLQDVLYRYNVRGWLTDINDVNQDSDSNLLFNFHLNYDSDILGSGAGSQDVRKLYNGNISQSIWKTANNDNQKRGYAYGYDDLNRITGGFSRRSENLDVSDNYSIWGATYDKNGNIQKIARHGNNSFNEPSLIDDLAYKYDGNRLLSVDDTSGSSLNEKGFNDSFSNASIDDFVYDENGNVVEDKNKGITSITYNHLNLPTSINVVSSQEGTGIMKYYYDALGTKIEKQKITEVANDLWSYSVIESTEYANNFVYTRRREHNSDTGPKMQFFNHPEGYSELVGSSLSGSADTFRSSDDSSQVDFKYIYQYKDHLGNVRLTYADTDGNGSINPATEIISEKNYYPFGLEHKGYNNVIVGSENNYFNFNGKELDESLGLNVIEMDWRQYDPALGRFNVVDPLAEERDWLSPYNFAQNNPILRVDPTGLLDDYGIDNETGNISLIRKTDDNTDTLYAGSGEGENFVKDESKGSVTINKESDGTSILSQLDVSNTKVEQYNDYGTIKDRNVNIAVTDESNKNDAFKVFKFAADNSKVEFSLGKINYQGLGTNYQIGTYHDRNLSPGVRNSEMGNVLGLIHSHPNQPTKKDRNESIGGDTGVSTRFLSLYGADKPYRIYFPNTQTTEKLSLPKESFLRGSVVRKGKSSLKF